MSTSDLDSNQDAVGFHTRLDFQVAVAVTMVVAFAVTAALMIATRVVTADSLDRASSDLAAARSAFYRLEDDRAQFPAAVAALLKARSMLAPQTNHIRCAIYVGSMALLPLVY